MKPITEIRVVEFTYQVEIKNSPNTETVHEWRFEFHREGDEDWLRVPVVRFVGKPDD